MPIPWKLYPGLDPIPLPREVRPTRIPALDAIAGFRVPADRASPLDLETLARLCHLANGVTRVRRVGDERTAFRAAGTTGAL